MRSKINIIHGDCMKYMKDMKDNEYDLALVDPPYGIGHDAIGMSNRASNSPKFRGYSGKQFAGGNWDSKPMSIEYFKELIRVSKHQIIWGANHFIENIPSANSSSWVVWYKNGQNPNSTNADCELARTSHKTAVKYFRYDWSGFGAVNSGEQKIHPTQKPVRLYKWLLQNYAKEGDKILDTHLGSGSIAIACWDLKFDLTAYEIDKEYYDNAIARLTRHQDQGQLF